MIISRMQENERLQLIPDLQNVHDLYAVKICRMNGEQVGFLNADISVEIRARILAGSPIDVKVMQITNNPKQVLIALQKYSRRIIR